MLSFKTIHWVSKFKIQRQSVPHFFLCVWGHDGQKQLPRRFVWWPWRQLWRQLPRIFMFVKDNERIKGDCGMKCGEAWRTMRKTLNRKHGAAGHVKKEKKRGVMWSLDLAAALWVVGCFFFFLLFFAMAAFSRPDMNLTPVKTTKSKSLIWPFISFNLYSTRLSPDIWMSYLMEHTDTLPPSFLCFLFLCSPSLLSGCCSSGNYPCHILKGGWRRRSSLLSWPF